MQDLEGWWIGAGLMTLLLSSLIARGFRVPALATVAVIPAQPTRAAEVTARGGRREP